MDKRSALSLAPLAALLIAGAALAQQPVPAPDRSDADVRFERACTLTTLPEDTAMPCADGDVSDRWHSLPPVVNRPGAVTSTSGNSGSGSTGTSMGNSGTQSVGAATSSTISGAPSAPARR